MQGRGVACLVVALALLSSGCGNKSKDTTTTSSAAPTGTLSLLAGVPGAPGLIDGTALASSRLNDPLAIATDGNGNYFVADSGNNTIRWLSHNASGWQLRTLAGIAGQAGSSNGDQSHALFYSPSGIAYVPGTPAALYVTDTGNNVIRKITFALDPSTLSSTASVSTYAGQAGTAGSTDGQGSAARFNAPSALAADSAGVLYVSDTGNNLVRRIDSSGNVSVLAGAAGTPGSADGLGASASFNGPEGIVVSGSGSGAVIFVADSGNSTIRRIDGLGNVTTWAGTAGVIGSLDGGSQATFYSPTGLALDSQGNLYVSDTGNELIRVVDSSQQVSTVAGQLLKAGSVDATQGLQANFNTPAGMVLTPVSGSSDSLLLVADSANDTLREFTAGTTGGAVVVQNVSTLVGSAGLSGSADGTGVAALFGLPQAMVADSAGNIFLTDFASNTVRELTPDGNVYTLAGDGTAGFADGVGSVAQFNGPYGIAMDTCGSKTVLFVSDYGNDLIRRLVLTADSAAASGWDVVVDTYAGAMAQSSNGTTGTVLVPNPGALEGTGSAAEFDGPRGIVIDPVAESSGLHDMYVADFNSDIIRQIKPTAACTGGSALPQGIVTNYAGSAYSAGALDAAKLTDSLFNGPAGLAIGVANVASGAAPAGTKHLLYVTDSRNNAIRTVDPESNGDSSSVGYTPTLTFANTAYTSGSADGDVASAMFANPEGLTFDNDGNLFVADLNNDTVRKISHGKVTTVAGQAGKVGFLTGDLPSLLNAPVGILFRPDSGHVYVTSSTVLADIKLP